MTTTEARRPVETQTRAEDASGLIGHLLGDVGQDLSKLIRQELELAKIEARSSAKRVGWGTGMLGGAAVAAMLALVFFSVAGWSALGGLIGAGWSGLVVAGCWCFIALTMALVGRTQMRKITGLPQTAETIRRIPDAVRGKDDGFS